MKRRTHRTEIRIETHEITIIRFGKHVDVESDDTETALVNEDAARGDYDGNGMFDATSISSIERDVLRREIDGGNPDSAIRCDT